MNLLFEFIKHQPTAQRRSLATIAPRGTTGTVWSIIQAQATGDYDRESIIAQTGISTTHLDKICSELLSRCYQQLYGADRLALLRYLSQQPVYIRHYYTELGRLLRSLSSIGTQAQQADFVRQCFRMIHTYMPIILRDTEVSQRMAQQYVDLFTGEARREATFYVGCQLLLEEMESLFAASDVADHVDMLEVRFAALGSPLAQYSAEVVFDYYWARTYFYHACENFAMAHEVALSALDGLSAYHGEQNEINMLRFRLKVNEFLYFLSRFDEAYERYAQVLASPMIAQVPDRPYHVNRFIQLCLITGHIAEAGAILSDKLKAMGDRVEQLIIARDIITYVKYYLFNREYDRAFDFLQMGFDKNHKGKYIQYEIELRHLQTAYFYLSGQRDVVLDVCRRHIKFLRNHHYTSATSAYPHYYVLVKAMCDRPHSALSARYQRMYDSYQQGSFAVYGRLLAQMKEC